MGLESDGGVPFTPPKDKREFFIWMANSGAFHKKKVLLSTFAIIQPAELGKQEPQVGDIVQRDGKVMFLNESIEPHPLNGWKEDEPLFDANEHVSFKKGELPNLDRDVDTTYGIALVNLIMLVYPFKDKIPYMNGTIDYKPLEGLVIDMLEEGKINTDELQDWLKACLWGTGIMPLFVVPATERSLSGSPEAKALRNKLLKEREGRLSDPTALAEIDTQMAALDREYMKGDKTEVFYKAGKAFDIQRKRMYGIFGGETDLTDPSKMNLVSNSLEEEWDIEQMPAMVNALRMGSFYRGQETALGGTNFKDLVRMFQNTIVTDNDCGSKVGKPTLITKYNQKRMVGRTIIGGKKITTDSVKGLIGKKLILRSAQGCHEKGSNFCKVCVGDAVAANPNSIGMLAANLGASLMLVMMGAVHGRALKLVEIELDEIFA